MEKSLGWDLREKLEIEEENKNIESKIDVKIRLRWRWKGSENASNIVSKMVENSIKSTIGAVLEVFGDPLGAKMVQDASWIASGAPFGDLLGFILSPRWSKLGQKWPRWRCVGQLGPQDGQLGSSLGGILAHFSDLERDLRKNSGSVKTSVTMAFWLQIGESGGRVGGSWELCWLMLALC